MRGRGAVAQAAPLKQLRRAADKNKQGSEVNVLVQHVEFSAVHLKEILPFIKTKKTPKYPLPTP